MKPARRGLYYNINQLKKKHGRKRKHPTATKKDFDMVKRRIAMKKKKGQGGKAVKSSR